MRSAILSIAAALAVAAPASAQDLIFADGLEPGCPSSWNSATGWSCPDGDAPVTGNPTVEEAGDAGCPPGMALVDAFCIDRFEASLVHVPMDGGGPWSPYVEPGEVEVMAVSVRTATPQGHVSQLTAAAACAHAGKRLCTDAEWLRACRGPSAWTYPWGNDADPGRCNDHRDTHPLVEYYGTTEEWIWSMINQSCLNQLPASLERTASRPGCVSFEGVHDLMGNLLEWTDDPNGTFRGGSYIDSTINGPGCLYVTTAHDIHHRAFNVGFRCCADAL